MDSDSKEWTQKYIRDARTPASPTSPPRDRNDSKQESKTLQEHLPGSSANSSIPTPPSSASPTSSNFHRSNPFSDDYQQPSLLDSPVPKTRDTERGSTPRIEVSKASGKAPQRASSTRAGPSGRPRAASARIPGPFQDNPAARPRSASQARPHTRNVSLPPRFEGDMSHRPLEMIKRETKVANRASKHRRGPSQPDTIDALDTIGGGYHHDGPYEATLASRNVYKKYAPVNAVHETNMEAIRATPKEYMQDSLNRHVPLQGTAIIPSGEYDIFGREMHYEEGADLMREPDAEGGAYKRWPGRQYHPEDYKGKGEPSFTIERDLKAKKAERLLHPDQQPGDVELQPTGRHRSLSNGAYDASASGLAVPGDNSMNRSNTTGKRLSDGLKRRFGSIRRKKDLHAEAAH